MHNSVRILKMSLLLTVLISCVFIIRIDSYDERSPLDLFIVPFRKFRLAFFRYLIQKLEAYGDYRLQERMEKMYIIPDNVPFPCNVTRARSPVPPTSVHKLRPGDIDIIGAMGDSLTAGFGLTGIDYLDVFLENRDKSFSIGGAFSWRRHLTLSNILKEFNSNLFGFPVKPSLSIMEESQFNVAEGGAVSSNMPYMAKILVKRIISDKRVDLKKHWKMVTILIGCNDFCSELCYRNNPEDALEDHKKDMVLALRILRNNLPRTIVNIVVSPDVHVILRQKNIPLMCQIQHRISCPCIVGQRNYNHNDAFYTDLMKRWQMLDMEIANYEEFNRQDFTVVALPPLLNAVLTSSVDEKSYFSQDCFHWSQKGSALVANSLWNSLLEPIDKKTDYTQEFHDRFLCPSNDHPFIYTRENS